MSFKDPKYDPLQQAAQPRWPKRTLFLDRDNMLEARENWWRAYNELYPTAVGNLDDRHTWDVAWAAAIAAFSFIMEGRVDAA